ncbi:hypothetical protein [Cellulomonas fimi]|nr:hypothetical protein [Cellulomonas fimi]
MTLTALAVVTAAGVSAPATAAPGPVVASTPGGDDVRHGPRTVPQAVDLGTLGGAQTVPYAVDAHGRVVGTSQTADGRWHAFSWWRGRMTDLTPGAANGAAVDVDERGGIVVRVTATAGGPETSRLLDGRRTAELGEVRAELVNAHGQVAGLVRGADGTNPFVWTSGTRVDLGPVPGFEGTSSRLVDLDDHGRVLGIGLGPESFEVGYVWDGAFTPVGDPSAFGGNGVVDLSDSGFVLGNAYEGGPLLWRDGAQRWLGLPPGFTDADPVAVDEHGHAVANLRTDDGRWRAHLWDGDRWVALGPDDVTTRATDLDRHRVVGVVERAADPARTTAFLLQGDRFTELGAGTSGSVAAQALAGRYVLGTVTDADGLVRAVLWTTRGMHH